MYAVRNDGELYLVREEKGVICLEMYVERNDGE